MSYRRFKYDNSNGKQESKAMFIPPKSERVTGPRWGVEIADGWHQMEVIENKEGTTKKGDPKLHIIFVVDGADGVSKGKVEAHLTVGSHGFNQFLDVIAFDQGGEIEPNSLIGTTVWGRTATVPADNGSVFIKSFSADKPADA
jgi:hypothetical protein